MSSTNYSSEDFDKLGREELIKIFDQWKIGIFYHLVQEKKVLVAKFRPYLLASFFRIINHVITIAPTNIKYLGDMYYYDYDKGSYRPQAETYFTKTIKDWWKDRYLSIPLSKVFNDLRASTYMERADFDYDSSYIPVANGIIKLYRNDSKWKYKFIKNSPEYLVVNPITTKYDPSAIASRFLIFLNEVLPNQKRGQKWLQEWLGDCLRNEQEFDRALLPYGDGDNGKTTLLDLFKAMLGLENTVEMSIHTLNSNRFATAELYKKKALIGDDLSTRDLRYTDTFLKITGGTKQLWAERKGKDPFFFKSTVKCAWPANKLPAVEDETTAFLRRWLPIPFNVKFTNDPKRKSQIMEELTTPEELSGILNFALEGLIDLLNNDGYTDPPSIEEVRIIWRIRSGNAVVAYIYSDQVERGRDKLYLMSDFIEDVNYFALDSPDDISTMTSTAIGKSLSKIFPEVSKTRRSYNGKQVWFYKGIGKKDKEYLLDIEDSEQHDARELNE